MCGPDKWSSQLLIPGLRAKLTNQGMRGKVEGQNGAKGMVEPRPTDERSDGMWHKVPH